MSHKLIKVFLNILACAVIAYLAIVLLVFVFQRSLLYYPANDRPTKEALSQKNLQLWPSSNQYLGLISAGELTDVKGTVVIFHGNAGAAYHRSFYVDALAKQNLRVILAEYPGYGGRPGNPSEKTVVNDGIETLTIAYQKYGAPLYLWGESLGAGVVSSLAATVNLPVKGLVLFTPWDSLSELAQTHYPYLPARWLVKDRYNSVDNLKRFQGNVAVVLAEMDEVIPVKHGKRLYESIDTNKKLWFFYGAGHNSVPIATDLPWWKEVSDFLSQ